MNNDAILTELYKMLDFLHLFHTKIIPNNAENSRKLKICFSFIELKVTFCRLEKLTYHYFSFCDLHIFTIIEKRKMNDREIIFIGLWLYFIMHGENLEIAKKNALTFSRSFRELLGESLKKENNSMV